MFCHIVYKMSSFIRQYCKNPAVYKGYIDSSFTFNTQRLENFKLFNPLFLTHLCCVEPIQNT